jgi:hypothetical protein
MINFQDVLSDEAQHLLRLSAKAAWGISPPKRRFPYGLGMHIQKMTAAVGATAERLALGRDRSVSPHATTPSA